MAPGPFITCHALDTTTGKPAANINVRLKLHSPALSNETAHSWTGTTNSDGRVTAWNAAANTKTSLNEVVDNIKGDLGSGQQSIWSLTFDTGSYFGHSKTFWPEVELKFAAKKEEEHYHVPLLLGPWSYTTYRGS